MYKITCAPLSSPDEKAAVCEAVLRGLHEWFGVEASILDYISQCRGLPVFAARVDGRVAGFAALKRHTPYAQEICVMGVLKEFHRSGAGRRLVELCAQKAREEGARILTVKTLAETDPDPNYAKTRQFYLAMGFVPLEVFPTLWDKDNPCLLMAMIL